MDTRMSPGTVIAGRYRLLERMDQGGVAQVWHAEDQQLSRTVALKLLIVNEADGADVLERFRAEAETESTLKHTNIVAVHDWGQEDGLVYTVMEHLPGKTVRQLLQEAGRVDTDRSVLIAIQAASALVFAHESGIAHGNVAPHNIMVGPDDHVTLTSFGLVHRFPPQTGPPHPDADTYALGQVLYEMLTGISLFEETHLGGESGQPLRVREVNASVPPAVETVVMKAVSPRPEERYASAEEFLRDLENLAGVGVRKRRRVWPWVLAAVVLVALVVLGVWAAVVSRVVVPDVRGKTYVAAVAALDKAGFKTTIVSRQPSADVATGSVISQEPTAGSTVARGSQVGVVLSAGAPIVTVPSVTGQEVTSASSAITAAGLTVGKLTDRSSNDIPSGGVISQTPSAGTQVAPGTAVDLVISTGAATAILPDVRGMTQSAATDRLTALGLTVLPTSGFSSTVTSGSVFDQSPVPGSVVPSGTEVTIRVSQGAQPVTVPNVVGATESAATTSIVGVGLVPVSESTSVTVTSQVGIVQDEIPAAGTAVQPGSQVRIIVGRM